VKVYILMALISAIVAMSHFKLERKSGRKA